jgi:N-acetylmuramoyl-L-alanine amidase
VTSATHFACGKHKLGRIAARRYWARAPVATMTIVVLFLSSIACNTARSQQLLSPAPCDRSHFRIVLDVGHTVEAFGALSARNAPEFDFNLQLAERIEKQLVDDGFSNSLLMITNGKAKPSLFRRVALAERLAADLLLSIHHDSVPDRLLENWKFEDKPSYFNDQVSGYSLWVSRHNPSYDASLLFATQIGKQLKAQGLQFAHQYTERFMGRYQHQLVDADAGVYRNDKLIVLKDTTMPAVLLEAGSIINRDEELQMRSAERRDLISASVSSALQSFCNPQSHRLTLSPGLPK